MPADVVAVLRETADALSEVGAALDDGHALLEFVMETYDVPEKCPTRHDPMSLCGIVACERIGCICDKRDRIIAGIKALELE